MTDIRDPQTGLLVTEFDRDGYPIVNNIDHPALFWGQFLASLVGCHDTDEDEGDDQGPLFADVEVVG